MAKGSYTASDIEVLEGLEPVRERPGMFIAGTDTPAGLHQLVFEIVDNSVDEAMNGHANEITVTLHANCSSVTVSDNGRGIPVEKHPKYKKPALELILTTLHAGGKFSDKNYQTSGGLHGVGSSVVNALSEKLVARVCRDGREYEQSYSRGKPTSKLKSTKSERIANGTSIFFQPDPQIFPKVEFSADIIRENLRTKAYLNPGVRVLFINEAAQTTETFLYQEGLVAYLRQILEERKIEAIGGELFVIERLNGAQVNLAFAWSEETKEEFYSYVNGIHTPDGGSHDLGAKSGIVKAIRNYINVHNLLPKGVKLIAEDIREGLICLVAVKLPSAKFHTQFQGQTKSRLNNPEVVPIVEGVARNLEQVLNEKPTVAQAIVGRVLLASRAREASRSAVQSVTRKLGVSHRMNLPGKLADCSSNRTAETEVFIVEGDSAGGSAKQGRDRHFQAVLPLRGKVLNAIASSPKQVLENKELGNIVSALGCGVGEHIKLEKLRYGKVIILTDADADGMHIGTLLLAFFFSHLRALIEGGHLYLGKPPLYGVFCKERQGTSAKAERKEGKKTEKKEKGKKGEANVLWTYSDEELQELIATRRLGGAKIVRYKGLGEMNPSTLWETTLNPKTRSLLRVCVKDEELVRQGLQALMGSDSSTRYELIRSHAADLEIDV